MIPSVFGRCCCDCYFVFAIQNALEWIFRVCLLLAVTRSQYIYRVRCIFFSILHSLHRAIFPQFTSRKDAFLT